MSTRQTRTEASILILVLAVLVISSCATQLLRQSVESGDYTEVKRWIEAGADVNAQDI
jgi:hypothetical protein